MESRGVFRAALSGGATPGELSRQEFSSLPWTRTEIYWVDERDVLYDHPESNCRAVQADLLSRVPVLIADRVAAAGL